MSHEVACIHPRESNRSPLDGDEFSSICAIYSMGTTTFSPIMYVISTEVGKVEICHGSAIAYRHVVVFVRPSISALRSPRDARLRPCLPYHTARVDPLPPEDHQVGFPFDRSVVAGTSASFLVSMAAIRIRDSQLTVFFIPRKGRRIRRGQ
jgi:hypothetical protein